MEFFFPDIAKEIDWDKKPEFLDKELRQVSRKAKITGRIADKLIKVYRKNGKEAWVMVHIEIQSQKKPDFAKRVYVYNYRIYDLYDVETISLVILADTNSNWRPSTFKRAIWGCEDSFKFPIVKLLDYENRLEELEKSDNVFAIITAAHLKTIRTKNDPKQRAKEKEQLIKSLYNKGLDKNDILKLYKFIDWLMVLPKELERVCYKEIKKFEEKKEMKYVTTAEEIGIEKGESIGIKKGESIGRQKGRQEGRQEGESIGIKKGEKKKAFQVAQSMINKGFDISMIVDISGLPKQEVEQFCLAEPQPGYGTNDGKGNISS